jgi:hypothetical protein
MTESDTKRHKAPALSYCATSVRTLYLAPKVATPQTIHIVPL